MTLNEIAENIAYKMGDQFNDTLRQSIIRTVLVYRAKLIRDDLDRNTLSEHHFVQYLNIPLIETNIHEELDVVICNKLIDCIPNKRNNILKSKIPLPKSVRLKSWGKSSYKFIGLSNGSNSFIITTLDGRHFTSYLPYQDQYIVATIINNNLFILNNSKICSFLLGGIFENPIEAMKGCINNTFPEDTEFPIGIDMLHSIEKSIVTGEYPLVIKEDNDIELQDDKD